MTKAIVVHTTGGPEQMVWEDVTVGKPGPGQVRLRHTAVGLNYVDVYFRTGIYKAPSLPFTPGMEGAGVIEEVGPDVSDFRVGDRVAYASHPVGAYAEVRLMPADRLVLIPEAVTDQQAASLMLQGMTAQYLLRRVYPVQRGETILIHAAAGGVGLLVCQWAKALGAKVIGTVGSEEKAALAKANGCEHTILYRSEDIAKRVREITNGEGVPVVYDSIGRDTLLASLDCLRPMGLMVSFGNASGPLDAFDTGLLAAKGSLFFTRPTLFTYTAKRTDLVVTAKELFDILARGKIKSTINQTYPLSEAAQAHRDLEARKTTGSTVFTV